MARKCLVRHYSLIRDRSQLPITRTVTSPTGGAGALEAPFISEALFSIVSDETYYRWTIKQGK